MRKNLGISLLIFTLAAIPLFAEDPGGEAARREELRARLSSELSPAIVDPVFSDPRLVLNRKLFPQTTQKKRGRKNPDYSYILTKQSLARGRLYMKSHAAAFSRAERTYGIPKEAIAGILRIETDFGKGTGKFPVVTTLYTFAILAPKRKKRDFGYYELASFLLACHENGWDPFAVKGSWAGAIGIPQFEPSSYRRFGVDGNGDGKIDLWSADDAIASIANYLKLAGWGKSAKSERRAVYAYNHEHAYVRAVLAYSRKLRALSDQSRFAQNKKRTKKRRRKGRRFLSLFSRPISNPCSARSWPGDKPRFRTTRPSSSSTGRSSRANSKRRSIWRGGFTSSISTRNSTSLRRGPGGA